MSKFEKPGEFGVLQGKERKKFSNETAKEDSLVVVERASVSQCYWTSA